MRYSLVVRHSLLAKRTLSQMNQLTRLSCQRSIMTYPFMDFDALRVSGATAFSKHDFRDIRWVGVFGSFARETQTTESNVNIAVYRKFLDEKSPPDRLHLEDVLPFVWIRPVDIVDIEDCEIRDYRSIEALLCSRTIYGSGRDEEVIRLRREASVILASGHEHFKRVLQMIRKAQSIAKAVSEKARTLSPPLIQSFKLRL